MQSDQAFSFTSRNMWPAYPSHKACVKRWPVTNQNVQGNRHRPQMKGCNQASLEFKDCDSNSTVLYCGMPKWQWEAVVQRKTRDGGKIRYQLRIQRCIEWGVTLTKKMWKFRVVWKLGFVLRTSIAILKKRNAKKNLLFFVACLLFRWCFLLVIR